MMQPAAMPCTPKAGPAFEIEALCSGPKLQGEVMPGGAEGSALVLSRIA